MIPRKIHYVWLGRGKKSDLVLKCIETWKKFAPNYEIIEWNEDNFDLNCNRFVKEAYSNKKYAFASDYIRLYAIYNHGGIYMDTDCELKKPLDIFLKNDAFVGFEIDNIISTAIFGAAKGNEWIGKFLNYYDERPFVRENGEFDMLPNTVISTRLLSKYFGLKLNNKKQIIKSNIAVYPSEYFTLDSGTKNNYATHHFSASWHSKPSKYKLYVKRRMGNKIAWYGAYKWLYHSKGLISLLKKKK